MRRLILLLAMVGLLAAAASAGAVTLRYQGKAGEVRKYGYANATRMQQEGMGERQRSEITASGLMIHTIRSVEDGILTFAKRATQGEVTIKAEGEEQPRKTEMAETVLVQKIDAQGQLKEYDEDFTQPADWINRALPEVLAFPARDLKVGDTWADEKEIAGDKVGTMKLRWTRKLVALEPRQERACAKIETKYNGSVKPPPGGLARPNVPGATCEASMRFSGTILTWFDHQAGLMVETRGSTELLIEERWVIAGGRAGEEVEQLVKTSTITKDSLVLRK